MLTYSRVMFEWSFSFWGARWLFSLRHSFVSLCFRFLWLYWSSVPSKDWLISWWNVYYYPKERIVIWYHRLKWVLFESPHSIDHNKNDRNRGNIVISVGRPQFLICSFLIPGDLLCVLLTSQASPSLLKLLSWKVNLSTESCSAIA